MPVIATELQISHTMDGFIWGGVPLGIASASLVAGLAVDRFGARLVGFLAMFLSGVACGLRGMLYSGWSLAFTMIAFGVLTAFQAPTIPKILAEHVRSERLGSANGLTNFALTIGQAVVMLTAVAVLVPIFHGWRNFQMAAGAVMVIVSILWLIFVNDRMKHAGVVDIRGVIALGKDRQMVCLTTVFFLQFGGYIVLFGLLPRVLSESGLDENSTARAVTAWLLAVGLFNVIGAYMSDVIGRRKPFIIFGSTLCAVSLGLMMMLPVNAALSLLVLAGVGSGSFGSIVWALPAEMRTIGPQRVGAAIGFMLLFSQVATWLLAILTGFVADAAGLKGALAVLCLVHLAILIPARSLSETGFSMGSSRNLRIENTFG